MKIVADEKKGITVKIDAELHAEIRNYIEQHEGMTMADFITLAATDELHPKLQQKEEKSMENMRTLAFQVPENLFNRIKDYLHRNNMTQRQFVLGLIETEFDREQAQRENLTEDQENTSTEDETEGMDEDGIDTEIEDGSEENEEEESEGFAMTM